jgi:hypothetical protein
MPIPPFLGFLASSLVIEGNFTEIGKLAAVAAARLFLAALRCLLLLTSLSKLPLLLLNLSFFFTLFLILYVLPYCAVRGFAVIIDSFSNAVAEAVKVTIGVFKG